MERRCKSHALTWFLRLPDCQEPRNNYSVICASCWRHTETFNDRDWHITMSIGGDDELLVWCNRLDDECNTPQDYARLQHRLKQMFGDKYVWYHDEIMVDLAERIRPPSRCRHGSTNTRRQVHDDRQAQTAGTPARDPLRSTHEILLREHGRRIRLSPREALALMEVTPEQLLAELRRRIRQLPREELMSRFAVTPTTETLS